MSWLGNLFRPRAVMTAPATAAPVTITPVAVRAGDDLILTIRERLDSDDALALLDTLKKQLPGARIHLLTGFGNVQIQRRDGGSHRQGGDDRGDPPLPVRDPAAPDRISQLAQVREQGDVVVITYATQFRLIAVYIPPKQ